MEIVLRFFIREENGANVERCGVHLLYELDITEIARNVERVDEADLKRGRDVIYELV